MKKLSEKKLLGIFKNAKSVDDLVNQTGYSKSSITTIRGRLERKHGIKFPRYNTPPNSKKLTEHELVKIFNESVSLEELRNKIGKSNSGIRSLRTRLEEKYNVKFMRFSNKHKADKVLPAQVELLIRQIKDLESENKQLKGQAADTLEYKTIIHGCLQQEPVPPKWLQTKRSTSGEWHKGVPTLFLSDLHWGEIVHSAQVNYVNSFNYEVASKRLKRVMDMSIYLLNEAYSKPNYPGIVLPLGGDMLTGYIHEELRENQSETLFEALMSLLGHLIEVITEFHNKFGQVFIPCVVGNHGRLDKKPRMKNAHKDNIDWLLYQLLKKHFEKESGVTVMVPDTSDAYYKVYDVKYLLTHGDQFRGGAGISGNYTPWALGDFRKRKRQQALAQPYDTLLFGHFHTLSWGINSAFICNGSLKGYDEFAMKKNYEFEPPKQAFWLTHPSLGITRKEDIYAEDPSENNEFRTDWLSVIKD